MVTSEWFMLSPKSKRDPISRVAAAGIRPGLEIGTRVEQPFPFYHKDVTLGIAPRGSNG